MKNVNNDALYSFVIPGYGRSGGIRATVKLANLLIGRGYRVRILVKKPQKSLRFIAKDTVIKLLYPSTHNWLDNFNGKVHLFHDMSKCTYEAGEIIIGVGMWASNEIATIKENGITKVQYLHGHAVWDVGFTRNVLQHQIPKIVVASYLISMIRELSGQDTVGIVPNGVDLKEYYPEGGNNTRDGIGFIYGTEPAKDPEMLNELIHCLRIKFPMVPLYFFGSGPRPKVLKNHEYTRLPSISKSRTIYSKSMVWIIGSKSEGFSMPILEAMACGCVVVSTDCGGPSDLIVNEENGFLVEKGNCYAILEKVEKLINDKNARCIMQAKSFETARKFNWENTVDQFIAAIGKIANRAT